MGQSAADCFLGGTEKGVCRLAAAECCGKDTCLSSGTGRSSWRAGQDPLPLPHVSSEFLTRALTISAASPEEGEEDREGLGPRTALPSMLGATWVRRACHPTQHRDQHSAPPGSWRFPHHCQSARDGRGGPAILGGMPATAVWALCRGLGPRHGLCVHEPAGVWGAAGRGPRSLTMMRVTAAQQPPGCTPRSPQVLRFPGPCMLLAPPE